MMILVNKKGFNLFVLILFYIFFSVSCNHNELSPGQFIVNGETMGTTYQVKITVNRAFDQDFKEEIRDAIKERLRQVNLKMSAFLDDSEISRFNRSESMDWFSVSSETAEVVNTALKVSSLSEGNFDITVAPLIELWGFGKKITEHKVLNDEDIKEVLLKTGYKHLKVRNSPPAIKKSLSYITCNLSAIAKGFGVDYLADFLETRGIKDYLVEIGGEDRTSGINYQGRCWRIGILVPDTFNKIYKAVNLHNTSIATSGDYRNYFEAGGMRYSHTIDPKTGRPITHKLASVSVIHTSCMLADSYATAINVMGPKIGFEFAIRNKLAVLLIIREARGFREKVTPEFKEHLNYQDD
jgi:thiamine biosynthesis lipoprotein